MQCSVWCVWCVWCVLYGSMAQTNATLTLICRNVMHAHGTCITLLVQNPLTFNLLLQLRNPSISSSGGFSAAFRGHVKSGDYYILFQTVTLLSLTDHRYRLTGLQSHPFLDRGRQTHRVSARQRRDMGTRTGDIVMPRPFHSPAEQTMEYL